MHRLIIAHHFTYMNIGVFEIFVIVSQKIRKFLDEAKNGAVAISLGTNVRWDKIGSDKIQAVINAISKLKQRVIWKLKIKTPLQVPDNVMIVDWLPQNDVLSTYVANILYARARACMCECVCGSQHSQRKLIGGS